METLDTEPDGRTEQAPLLRAFGGLAALVARILRGDPALAARLVFAPPRAVHSVAAWLHRAQRAGSTESAMAARLAEAAPRSLLREALPDAPARLFQLLDRCPMPVWGLSYYAGLARVLREGVEDMLPGTRPILRGDVGLAPFLRTRLRGCCR